MMWTCPRCAATNDDTVRDCAHCGARLLFEPPPEAEEPEVASDSFLIPRRGELTAALRHGLESLRSGELPPEGFAFRLQRAAVNVPEVFAGISEQLGADEYSQAVRISLGDCQALFEAGLGEMLHGLKSGEDFHLRFGWLLVEKGEEEYIRILQALRRDAAAPRFEGEPDVIGRLAAAHERGELDPEGMRSALDSLENHLVETLSESEAAIREGIEQARLLEMEQARQHLARAARRLAQALLSVS